MSEPKKRTRIQEKNCQAILEAALDVFSRHGFRGATLDQIADAAGLSKPNLLYYFASKEAIYHDLLADLLDTWLEPMRAINPDGEPIDEVLGYVRAKLALSREYPRESRLFASDIIHGAEAIKDDIGAPLRSLVDRFAVILRGWMDAGRIHSVDPHHMIFSIWATTQHYADFDVQVRAVLQVDGTDHFDQAEAFLTDFYARALSSRQ
ncbi:MAG: TetR family transcriptional regulator C-terminal domain-containing protein [Deltaproteobacteria bacterium]